LSKKLGAEFFGTFIFVLVGAGSALGTASLTAPNSGTTLLVAAFGNGIGLAVAVTATLKISGGVLNPAVAIGLLSVKKLTAREAVLYIITEIVAATVAVGALVAAFPAALGDQVKWGSPALGGSVSSLEGAEIEALLTFVLMFAIYGTAVDKRAPHVGGIGIGLAVLVDVLVGGNLTGAAMNPARALGPMIAGGFYPGYWYIYIVGPVVGAVAAALVYHYFIESPKE
jgi:MIP family channel proteins